MAIQPHGRLRATGGAGPSDVGGWVDGEPPDGWEPDAAR